MTLGVVDKILRKTEDGYVRIKTSRPEHYDGWEAVLTFVETRAPDRRPHVMMYQVALAPTAAEAINDLAQNYADLARELADVARRAY